MSAQQAARARPQREVEPHYPFLRLVATRPLTVARVPFAIFVGSILTVGLVALLLLHTMAAQDAFRLEALQHQSAQLADEQQQLALAEQERQAPTALAVRARSLGMVPTGSIAFVDLNRHGKIVGVVQAAPSPPPPAPTASPTPTASASPGAGAAAKSDPSPKSTASPQSSSSTQSSASTKTKPTHATRRRVNRSTRH